MIKISYLYPSRDDGDFDFSYFCEKHIPLVEKTFGNALKRVEVEKGIQAEDTGTKPAFIVAAHLYFDSIDDFEQIFLNNKRALMVDLLQFTDIQAVVQFSELVISDTFDGHDHINELGVLNADSGALSRSTSLGIQN